MSNSRALAPHLARLDLDLIEKFLVATFMIVLAARLVPVVIATGALPPIFLLMSEGVVVLFILLRRPTQDIRGVVETGCWDLPAPCCRCSPSPPRAQPCCHGMSPKRS